MNEKWLKEMFDQRRSSREPISLISHSQGNEESLNDGSSDAYSYSDVEVKIEAGDSFSDAGSVRSIVINTIKHKEHEIDLHRSERKLAISFSEITLTGRTKASSKQHSNEDKEEEGSTSLNDEHATNSAISTNEDQKQDKFEKHFGPALQYIQDMLKAVSPFEKLKKLVKCLKEMAFNIEILRLLDGKSKSSACATSDDLLTLLVLMLLQMEPSQAASMCPQLSMVEGLMVPFLETGEYGFAVIQFQMALKVLSQLCSEF